MAETARLKDADTVFLYTEIGRGHPGYLDGIIEEFDSRYSDRSYYRTDVFKISSGFALAAWKLIRCLYRFGSRGGIVSHFYGLLRKFSGSGESDGLTLSLLGKDIKRFFKGYKGQVVVAHPLLARILAASNRVIYQHGELAAPAESLISGCDKILTPLPDTAEHFAESNPVSGIVEITGQCIEKDLTKMADRAYRQRLDRISGADPLTVALFSSGACPAVHMARLELIARSLFQAGFTVNVFLGQARQICEGITYRFRQSGLPVQRDLSGPGRIKLLTATGRTEENRQVGRIFERLDLFVAPAHERTNWTVGLGLPMLILCPHIGSYAPLNARIALEQKTALEIADESIAARVPEIIADLRQSGELHKMARRGYGHTDIDGFAAAARLIKQSG